MKLMQDIKQERTAKFKKTIKTNARDRYHSNRVLAVLAI